jgi:hypothetical protein
MNAQLERINIISDDTSCSVDRILVIDYSIRSPYRTQMRMMLAKAPRASTFRKPKVNSVQAFFFA